MTIHLLYLPIHNFYSFTLHSTFPRSIQHHVLLCGGLSSGNEFTNFSFVQKYLQVNSKCHFPWHKNPLSPLKRLFYLFDKKKIYHSNYCYFEVLYVFLSGCFEMIILKFFFLKFSYDRQMEISVYSCLHTLNLKMMFFISFGDTNEFALSIVTHDSYPFSMAASFSDFFILHSEQSVQTCISVG